MSFALVQVQVNDVNDNPPLFSQHNYSAFVHVSIIYIISIPSPIKKKKKEDSIIFFLFICLENIRINNYTVYYYIMFAKQKKSKQNL